MHEQGVPFVIGRDRLLNLLRDRDMLVRYDRVGKRTTNSYHTLPVFTNKVREQPARGPDEVWVCDLTYLRTLEGFCFLFLLSDQYSRKIVGYHLSRKMETADALEGLRKAAEDLPQDRRPTHHSDRGCQYCSHEYVQELSRLGLSVSMTEENHCYENAQAERLNGILKQEYGLGATLPSMKVAAQLVDQAVFLYNNLRPHRSLDLDYPVRVHRSGKILSAAPRGADMQSN